MRIDDLFGQTKYTQRCGAVLMIGSMADKRGSERGGRAKIELCRLGGAPSIRRGQQRSGMALLWKGRILLLPCGPRSPPPIQFRMGGFPPRCSRRVAAIGPERRYTCGGNVSMR